MMNIFPIQAFQDNYIWLLYQNNNTKAYVVDPGDAKPVIATLKEKGLNLSGILITHHHYDHTSGIKELIKSSTIPVYGPKSEAISHVTHPLTDSNHIELFEHTFQIIDVPGHTNGHIAYFCQDHTPPVLFCGDTLFAGGCGRLFEGTAEQMYSSLAKLSQLPNDTQAYCAHEYTIDNLRFAQTVEPDNKSLIKRIEYCKSLREKDLPTVPSTLHDELQTNPFLRCNQPSIKNAAKKYSGKSLTSPTDIFQVIRQWKDDF